MVTGGSSGGVAAVGGAGIAGATAGRAAAAGAGGTGQSVIPVGVAGASGASGQPAAGTPAGASGAPAVAGSTAAGSGGSAGSAPPAPTGNASVLEYHKNPSRDGHYIDAAFTRTAAAALKKDPSFAVELGADTYAQPLYFEGGPDGKDLLITATEANVISAHNAADGAMVWTKTLAPPVTGGLPCGNISPLGVTGTPVIDAASRTLYAAAMTSGPKHQVFALALDTGEIKPGFPVDVSSVTSNGQSFNPAEHNQRGALVIVGGNVFVPYGGHYGDCGGYHGWVIGVPLAGGAPTAWATDAHAGGIWAPGGLASDGTSVFASTGNTMSDAGGIFSTPGSWGHGNAILRLSPSLGPIAESATADFFTPNNWEALDQGDLDLGGSGPVIIEVPGATPTKYAVALGKSGDAWLVGLQSLGGMGGELGAKKVASGGIGGGMIQAAAAYTTAAGSFVAFRAVQTVQGCGGGTSGYLGALKIGAGSPPTFEVAWCAGGTGVGSPIVTTTDGTNDSIVWYMARGSLLGFNGDTGEEVFAGGGSGDSFGTIAKFQTPIVAKGRIFLATRDGVIAYT
ncbi:MAG: hypothetical protein ABW321_02525, partial [Polyangiales bacterium]